MSDVLTQSEVVTPSRSEQSVRKMIAVGVGMIALAIYLWQLSVPESIGFYDSGVYMAATIHFVSGILPYRDFIFVNPPGILLLMVPVGIFSRLFGSHDGLIVAQVSTSVVTALNASLLAWLVRYRGNLVMVATGIGLAILPISLFVSSDLKLDPYSICFVLLGSIAILPHRPQDREVATRKLVVGGVLFGLAAVTKLWAFFPFVALTICLLPLCRRRVSLFIGGAAIGFIVPSLPFFYLAPGNFIHQVFTVQLFQKTNPVFGAHLPLRLVDLTGVYPTSISPTSREAIVAFAALALFLVIATLQSKTRNLTDYYLVLASAITVAALLSAPAFQLYWAYYSAPFLVGALAISISNYGERMALLWRSIRISNNVRRFLKRTSVGISILLILALVLAETTFFTNYSWSNGKYGPYVAEVDKFVPRGSCVVYDWVYYGVYANRLSNNSNCPSVIDPYGMWLDSGFNLSDPSPEFVAEWKKYFEDAQYVVLNSSHTIYVPWGKTLRVWFNANYHLLYGRGYVQIFANNAR